MIKLATPGAPQHLVPSRLSQSTYHRYEPFIKDYLASWPHPKDFTPEDCSVETFAKCLRNAIRSVIAYQWPTADIDIARLAAIWPASVVSQFPTGVRIGPRDTPRAPELGKPTSRHSFEVDATDTLAVKAAIVLLARQKLTAPVLLIGDPQVAFDYVASNTYDVAITPCPEAGAEAFLML
jgi:hypothetical protein